MNKLKYSNYNSILNEGHRIRRMRRTQLSINKISQMDNLYMIPSSKDKIKSHSTKSLRSIPKVQKSCDKKIRGIIDQNQNFIKIQNEYYTNGKESRAQQISGNLERNFFRNIASKKQHNVYTSQPYLPSKPIQQYSAQKQKSKLSVGKNKNGKFSIRRTQRQQIKGKVQVQLINQLQQESLKNESKQGLIKQQSVDKNSSNNQDVYELGNNSQSFILDQFQGNENKGSVLVSQLKKCSIKGLSQNNQLKSKISTLKLRQNQQSQQFIDNQSSSSQEQQSGFSQSQGVSILKASKIGTSLNKKSSSYIKSLGSQSILKQTKQVAPTLEKRMQLKLQSLRKVKVQNNHQTRINSLKNLPLTSRQNSQRKQDSVKSRPMGNSLQQVVERIEIHDFIITLLSDFGDQTLQFHKGEENKYQKLIYLLERKNFLQKSNMIKTLKGFGKNVFNLSSIQIPSQIIKKYLQNRQIKQIIQQQQQTKKKLFKKLQKSFKQIKNRYKDDPYIKLQTPNDNFSKCIVNILHTQLNQLYPVLQKLTGQKLQRQQDRIIQIIQKIFVLSEFAGRKVKKLQFSEQIQDFDGYYQDNLQNLLQTLQYFQNS